MESLAVRRLATFLPASGLLSRQLVVLAIAFGARLCALIPSVAPLVWAVRRKPTSAHTLTSPRRTARWARTWTSAPRDGARAAQRPGACRAPGSSIREAGSRPVRPDTTRRPAPPRGTRRGRGTRASAQVLPRKCTGRARFADSNPDWVLVSRSPAPLGSGWGAGAPRPASRAAGPSPPAAPGGSAPRSPSGACLGCRRRTRCRSRRDTTGCAGGARAWAARGASRRRPRPRGARRPRCGGPARRA